MQQAKKPKKIFKVEVIKYIMLFLICFFSATSFADECIKGSCENGYGIYAYNNGAIHKGKWRKGKVLSQGRWLCTDGTEYVGEWKFIMTSKDFTTWRKQNNYSKEQLARAFGVSLQTVNVWEKGITEPPHWLDLAIKCMKWQKE